MTTGPLRVYAYERPGGKLNFGDDMSPAMVEHVTGHPVRRTSWEEAQVLAIGSILHHVLRRKALRRMFPAFLRQRPVVWGSGLIGPQGVFFRRHLRFLSVRGPHTAAGLRLGALPFGDPGLLAREVVDPLPKAHGLGIVPHYAEADQPGVRALAEAFPDATVIDVEQDWRTVLQQISSCKAILSSSLHGLIVADSYGIPNKRITFSQTQPLSDFKFRDYAEGIGRPDGCLLAPDHITAAKAALGTTFDYGDRIDATRKNLHESGARIMQIL